MNDALKKAARFLGFAAMGLFLLLLALCAISALGMTARSIVQENRMNQQVLLLRDHLPLNLLLTAGAALLLALVHALLEKYAGKKCCTAAAAIYILISMAFVWAVGLLPRADSHLALEAAKQFAAGDFGPMHSVYFNRVSYQLGLVLPMEMIARLLPGADLNMAMQVLNCVLTAACAWVLCLLAGEIAGDARSKKASMLLLCAYVSMLLFNMFVYGVLPMLLLCALAMLCFARYIRTGRKGYGAAYALLIGLAAMIKPNAMIMMLALLICAVVHALERKDAYLSACALVSAALCVLLPRGVIAFYEMRSGVQLVADTGMLLRLAMGMQDSVIAAGWYNGMIEEYWDLSVTAQAEKAAAMQMLGARLGEFAADPALARQFFAEKYLTQWTEPTYDILWYGAVCEEGGRFNGLAHLLFRDDSPVRAALEGYMNLFQQAVYVFALAGVLKLIKDGKTGPVELMLPVTILGGFLYHMLFEAKSQYLYPYMLLMIPLAAQGLSCLSAWIARKKNETAKKLR